MRLTRSTVLPILYAFLLTLCITFVSCPTQAATFAVTTVSDEQTNGNCDAPGSGDGCTLREAMTAANSNAGTDAIIFKIGAVGSTQTILIKSPLPEISPDPVIINGFSQGGSTYAGIPLVIIKNDDYFNDFCFKITAGNSTVRGLQISGFRIANIRLDGAGSNVIQGNYIGFTGNNQIYSSSSSGIEIHNSANNLIGGSSSSARNVISGNYFQSIFIHGGNSRNNRVQGNYIGLTADGTATLNYYSKGIVIDGASQNFIGGGTAQTRNIISCWGGTRGGGNGNNITIISSSGVGSDTTGNVVQGNYIGTDVTGTVALKNSSVYYSVIGVLVSTANGNKIGGATVGMRNLISGNSTGIVVNAGDQNSIQGNYIGTDVSGSKSVANGNGISLREATHTLIGGSETGTGNLISGNMSTGIISEDINGPRSSSNTIKRNLIGTDFSGNQNLGNKGGGIFLNGLHNVVGGTAKEDGNRIAFNGRNGVTVFGTNNSILSNSIYNNGGLGIDLNNDGPTANDAKDVDTGANFLMNHPVLSPVQNGVVQATLNSEPSKTFRLEFFANLDVPIGKSYQGQTFIGAQNITTDSSGLASTTFSPPAGVNYVTATSTLITSGATSVQSTSEFSPVSYFDSFTVDLDADNSSKATGFDYKALIPANGIAPVTNRDATIVNTTGLLISGAEILIQGDRLNLLRDLLTVDTTGTNITANFDSSTFILTLSGNDSTANYEKVLRSLSYVAKRQIFIPRTILVRLRNTSGIVTNTATTVLEVSNNKNTVVVSNATDQDDGFCTLDNCSLREAINYTNFERLDSGNSYQSFQILFDLQVFNPAGPPVSIKLNSKLPRLGSLKLIGPGASVLTIDGTNSNGIFEAGGLCSLIGLTIANTHIKSGYGAGIFNSGDLTLENCVIRNNRADANSDGSYQSGFGGGVANERTLHVINCSFIGNNAVSGGAIYNSYHGNLEITDCNFQDNSADGDSVSPFIGGGGGAVCSSGNLIVTNCIFQRNTAVSSTGYGGALQSGPSSTRIDRSTFSENRARNGGAVAVSRKTHISNSTFNGNTALAGGAIYAFVHLECTIYNCTISRNQATGTPQDEVNGGGGILFDSFSENNEIDNMLDMSSCTITGNSTPNLGGRGAGISIQYARVNLSNNIIAKNTGQDIDYQSGSLTNNRYNLIGNNSGVETIFPAGLPSESNKYCVVGTASRPVDPLLAPLADNGGPTQTHALLNASLAIDKGGNYYQDQRGFVRPYDRADIPNSPGGNGSDIGAFESRPIEPPAISIHDVVVKESSGAVQAVFKVSLNYRRASDTVVNYQVSNGEALDGKDYSSAAATDSDRNTRGTLTIPQGQQEGTITVPILDDNLKENDERFYVILSLPSGSTGITLRKARGVAAIKDNEPVPQISVADIKVPEGNGGTFGAVFTLKLSTPSEVPVSVTVSTQNGTASASQDYKAQAPLVVKFNTGSNTAFVRVETIGDTIDEADETFYLQLSNATNAIIGRTRGTCTISDDDTSG